MPPPKVCANNRLPAYPIPAPVAGTFEITFDGYTGAVEALVVDTNQLTAVLGTVVTAEVITVQEGTEPLLGDFTLSFRGQETPALSLDAADSEVRCHVVHSLCRHCVGVALMLLLLNVPIRCIACL